MMALHVLSVLLVVFARFCVKPAAAAGYTAANIAGAKVLAAAAAILGSVSAASYTTTIPVYDTGDPDDNGYGYSYDHHQYEEWNGQDDDLSLGLFMTCLFFTTVLIALISYFIAYNIAKMYLIRKRRLAMAAATAANDGTTGHGKGAVNFRFGIPRNTIASTIAATAPTITTAVPSPSNNDINLNLKKNKNSIAKSNAKGGKGRKVKNKRKVSQRSNQVARPSSRHADDDPGSASLEKVVTIPGVFVAAADNMSAVADTSPVDEDLLGYNEESIDFDGLVDKDPAEDDLAETEEENDESGDDGGDKHVVSEPEDLLEECEESGGDDDRTTDGSTADSAESVIQSEDNIECEHYHNHDDDDDYSRCADGAKERTRDVSDVNQGSQKSRKDLATFLELGKSFLSPEFLKEMLEDHVFKSRDRSSGDKSNRYTVPSPPDSHSDSHSDQSNNGGCKPPGFECASDVEDAKLTLPAAAASGNGQKAVSPRKSNDWRANGNGRRSECLPDQSLLAFRSINASRKAPHPSHHIYPPTPLAAATTHQQHPTQRPNLLHSYPPQHSFTNSQFHHPPHHSMVLNPMFPNSNPTVSHSSAASFAPVPSRRLTLSGFNGPHPHSRYFHHQQYHRRRYNSTSTSHNTTPPTL